MISMERVNNMNKDAKMVNMSDQQVIEIPALIPDTQQHAVCEDCGRSWVVECNSKDINLCLDNQKMEEIKNPAILLTILREETDPLSDIASLNSPAQLTCMVLGAKDKIVYQWKVNHKGIGSPAYSGCKLVPVWLAWPRQDRNMENSKISSYSDENITISKPIKRKRTNNLIDISSINSDMTTEKQSIISAVSNENSSRNVEFRTDMLKTDTVEADTHIHSSIQNTMYCDNVMKTLECDNDVNGNNDICKKSDCTNESRFNVNIDCAVQYKIEEVDVKEECLMEESQESVETTDQHKDLPKASSSLPEANTNETNRLESQGGNHKITLLVSRSKIEKQYCVWGSNISNQHNSQGFKGKLMQLEENEKTPQPESFIDSNATKCSCGLSLNPKECMLECQRCKRWFDEKCVGCLQYKIICGDIFYLYVCALCNGGKEFLHRLPINWGNIVHLALWNLTKAKKGINGKYYEYDEQITTWVNNNWELLQCPPDLQTIPIRGRSTLVLLALTENTNKFRCGKEGRMKKSLWALRNVDPPSGPKITLPLESPMTSAMMQKIMYCERTTESTLINENSKVETLNAVNRCNKDDTKITTPFHISGSTAGGETIHKTIVPWTIQKTIPIPLQLPLNQTIMQFPRGSSMQSIPNLTQTRVKQPQILQILLPNGHVQNIKLSASSCPKSTFTNMATPSATPIGTMGLGVTTPSHTTMAAASMRNTEPSTLSKATPSDTSIDTLGITTPAHTTMPVAFTGITSIHTSNSN